MSKIPPQFGEAFAGAFQQSYTFVIEHTKSNAFPEHIARRFGDRSVTKKPGLEQLSETRSKHAWTRELLEELFPTRQHVVQRILEMRRRLRKLAPDLIDVLLEALLDLIAEQRLERPVA